GGDADGLPGRADDVLHPPALSRLRRTRTATRARCHGRPAAGRRADVGAELHPLSRRRDVAALERLRAAPAQAALKRRAAGVRARRPPAPPRGTARGPCSSSPPIP